MTAKKTNMQKFIKEFGDGILRTGNDIPDVDYIPSGVLSLDIALGSQGWPLGRVVELYGPEAGGKSTLALKAIAEAQKLGMASIYVDLERTYDPKYAALLGVDSNNISAPTFETGEAAIDAIEAMICNWDILSKELGMYDKLGIVVIDSVAALLPSAEKDSDIGNAHVGLIGRLMSKVSRKFTPLLAEYNVCMMYINQLRATINSGPFAPKTSSTGGNAIKYYASIRVDVRRIGRIKQGDKVVGANIRMLVNKSKMAGVEGSEAVVEMYHGKGYSETGDIITLAEERKIIKKGGAWYNYKDHKFQGKGEFKIFLRDNPEVMQEIRQEILNGLQEPIVSIA